MSDEIKDVVIVGGGPAGMSAAWHLGDDVDFVLLNDRDRLGGRLYSEPRGDYWINFGGHLFPGAGSTVAKILGDLGLHTIEIPGSKTSMEFEGRLYDKRAELYPLILPLSLKERISFARAGLRVLKAVKQWQKANVRRAGESEAAFRTRMADYFGDGTFASFLGKLPERVDRIFRTAGHRASSELEQQSTGVGMALFGSVWAGDKGPGANALNLSGGSGEWGRAMQERLGARAVLNAEVTSVVAADDVQTVTYRQGGVEHEVRARRVIVAIPAPLAAKIVHGIPDRVTQDLASTTYGPFVSGGFITAEPGPMPWDGMYAITATSGSFDMVFNHANPLRGAPVRTPGGSLMVYSGGLAAERLLGLTETRIGELYAADLVQLFPQLEGRITEVRVVKWEHGNVYRAPGRDLGALLEHSESGTATVHFAGDFFTDLGSMEASAGSGASAAAMVRASLGRS